MTEPLRRASSVKLLDVHRLRLVEATAPSLTPEDRVAMDRAWEKAVRANPSLFDGPVVACARLEQEGPDGLVLSWARTTYRQYVLRKIPSATSWLPSLYVTVLQPTDDGRLLVGRMSPSTATPGRWQLPGGCVEPPADDESLDVAALHRHAARELAEETGLDTPPGDLTPWLVTRGTKGSVGVLFRAPSRPASLLRERFAALVAAETALGRDPELDRIALIRSPAELPNGDRVDYLEPVVRRYGSRVSPCRTPGPPGRPG